METLVYISSSRMSYEIYSEFLNSRTGRAVLARSRDWGWTEETHIPPADCCNGSVLLLMNVHPYCCLLILSSLMLMSSTSLESTKSPAACLQTLHVLLVNVHSVCRSILGDPCSQQYWIVFHVRERFVVFSGIRHIPCGEWSLLLCSSTQSNRLNLNPDKTQFIWIGNRFQLPRIDYHLLSAKFPDVVFKRSVLDHGVALDQELTMSVHVGNICRSGFYQLRQLRIIRRSLTFKTAATLIHALVISRIDYCNAVLSGITKQPVDRVQKLLNTAARLLLRIPKFGHISVAIRDTLHWLPVSHRVLFKSTHLFGTVSRVPVPHISPGTVCSNLTLCVTCDPRISLF